MKVSGIGGSSITTGTAPSTISDTPIPNVNSGADALETFGFYQDKVWGIHPSDPLSDHGILDSYDFTVQVNKPDPAHPGSWIPDPTPSGRTCSMSVTNPISEPMLRGGGDSATVCIPCLMKSIGRLIGAIAADPVNTATGSFYDSFTDVALPGRGPALTARRTYDSGGAQNGTPGMFGPGWASPYDETLNVSGTAAGSTATWTQSSGAQVSFVGDGAGYWTTQNSLVSAKLIESGSTWTATTNDGTVYTFAGGTTGSVPLTGITDRNGYVLSFSRTSSQLTVSNHVAPGSSSVYQSLVFDLDTSGRVTDVVDPIGRTVTYGYDSNGNLHTASVAHRGVVDLWLRRGSPVVDDGGPDGRNDHERV